MSRIIVPQRRVWTRKPQRVVAALNPQDAAYAAGGVLASGSSYLPTFSGAARLSGGCLILPSIGSYVEFPHGAIPITQDFTITLTFRTGASLISQTLLASSINKDYNRSIRILISSATSVQFLVADDVGYWVDDTKTLNGITLQPHTLYTFCARFKYLGYDSVQKNITIAGKSTTYTTSVGYGINPPSALRFGREAAMTGYDFVGEIHGYFCETRYVSDSEAVSRSINPWSLFKPRRRVTYIDLGAGSTYNLTIAEASHSHAVDSLLFSSQDLLTVSDASHGQTADNLGLSTQWLLAVQDALHSQASDNLTLSTTGSNSLDVQEATHAHFAEQMALVTTWLLTIAEASHGHAADNVTLDTSNATWLTVQDAGHAQSSDYLALSLDTWLAIVDAAHAHYADSPLLTAETTLAIAEALHAVYSDTLVLSFPGATTLTADDIQAIAAAVLAALQGTTIPVDAVQGSWPTADENASAVWSHEIP